MAAVTVLEAHKFLQRFYHPSIVDLAAEFPEERTLYIDWNDLNEYNGDWPTQLRQTPQATLNMLETALATYPLKPPHGQLSFEEGETKPDEAPFVRIQNVPHELKLEELPKACGRFVRVTGRVTEVGIPEARIATAVFECDACGNILSKPQVGDGIETPNRCESCDTSKAYRFNSTLSTYADSQVITLAPLTYHESPTIAVELRHELIDSLHLNAGVAVTGTAYSTGLSGRFPDITILANTVEQTQKEVPHPTVTYADQFLDVEPAVDDEFSHALAEFVKRSCLILERQSLTEEDAQAKIITPFIHLLGWNIYSEQVALEYSTSGSSGHPDYMLFDAAQTPRIPVEAKSPDKNLDNFVDQIERYLDSFDCNVGLLTTGEEYRLYERPPAPDADLNRLFTLKIGELPANEPLVHLLRETVVSETESIPAVFSE